MKRAIDALKRIVKANWFIRRLRDAPVTFHRLAETVWIIP
jgi:hypothetical protein